MTRKSGHPYSEVPSIPGDGSIGISELLPKSFSSVELEIGFGKGRFILDRAEANPDIGLVGIETRRKWVQLVTERAEKREVSNVHVWFGNAKAVLPRIEQDACLKRVFINFPDPWWKERHKKRIVVVEQLIEQVARLLEDKGELFLQTDVDFRAEYYLDVVSSNNDLEPYQTNGVAQENPYGAKSLRETRCEEIGLPIYRILFRRKPRA